MTRKSLLAAAALIAVTTTAVARTQSADDALDPVRVRVMRIELKR